MRHVAVGFILAFLLTSCASDVILTASPGETPGMTMGPFTPNSSAMSSSTISAQAQNYPGWVNYRLTCCYDAVRDVWSQFSGLSTNLGANATDFSQTPNATINFPLTIWVAADAFGVPVVPFGKYVARVDAQTKNGTVSANVGAKILLTGISEPAAPCRPSVEVLPLAGIVPVQITAAEASPRVTHLVIAMYSLDGHDTWRWEIDDFPALLPTEADVVLDNETASDKEITTTGCSSNGQDLIVQSKQRAHMKIVQNVDQTIVFKKKSGSQMNDVSTFSPRSFWSVFGRKRMTFTWLKD